MRCGLDLYIHSSNDRGGRLFYLLTRMIWFRLSSSLHCCISSIVFGPAVPYGFYWPGVVYRWLLWLGPGPKTFHQRRPPYSLGVVQSIAHYSICVDAAPTWHVMLVLDGEGSG